MQVRLSDLHAVKLALQHGANHNVYTLSFTLAKQAKRPALRNFRQYCPIFSPCLLG